MNKRKYKSIACAFALATSFATINFSPAYAAAEDETSNTEASAEDTGVTTTAAAQTTADAPATADQPVDGAASTETAATVAPADAKAPMSKEASAQANKIEAWRAVRPDEAAVKQAGQSYVGQTVVSVDAAGSTLSSQAMAAVKLKAGDVLGAESVSQDRQAIYETGLFYDVYPTFVAVPEGVKITYHVMENPVLKSIEIVGNKALDTKTIKDMLTVPEGQILNSKALNANISEIEARYRKDGFILSKISDINMSNEGVLRLTFNEGLLEGYAVKGNEKTKSNVIIREMRMKPGEAFNVKKARRSMQRVYNLGFFEDVNMKLNPGRDPNAIILEVDVVEKRTGNFAVGAGYSSSDGFIGMVSIGDKNFRGTGDSVNLSYEFSGSSTDNKGYVFTYTRPWLDKKETTGTVRIYNRTYQYDDYDTSGNLKEEYRRKYSGGEITLGRPVSEYSTNYVTLRNRTDKYVSHVADEGTDRSTDYSWISNNFGLTRSLTLQHVTDTRDNVYNPMSGGRVSLKTEFAGFGGDFNYQKYTIEDNRYIKVGHAQVIALRGQYGRGNGSIPESAQYQLGGQDSLRGYRDDQFKGNNMLSGTIEYRFPIVSKVQGALFTDFGNAWNDSTWSPGTIHHSIGVGLQLETPIGPIRFDVGHGEDGNRTDFSVGGTF